MDLCIVGLVDGDDLPLVAPEGDVVRDLETALNLYLTVHAITDIEHGADHVGCAARDFDNAAIATFLDGCVDGRHIISRCDSKSGRGTSILATGKKHLLLRDRFGGENSREG
jgi:hypothetical protein